jgi:hypothetical protein
MELSARDKRILAEIECQSALEDPTWVRRFERLARRGGEPRGMLRRLGLAAALLGWTAAVVLGATIAPRPVLWAALGLAVLGLVPTAVWRRWSRDGRAVRRARRPRLPRVPRQSEPGGRGDLGGTII